MQPSQGVHVLGRLYSLLFCLIMATLPDQLKLPTPGLTGLRNSNDWAAQGVYSDGFTPPSAETVNDVLFQCQGVFYNTLPLEYPRTDKRFRLFDTSFGDVVIYPAGVPITGGKTYRQVVDDLRAAWATYTLRGDARTGLATSVDNS